MSIGKNVYNILDGDKYIWLIVAFLSLASIMAVYSATGSRAYLMHGGNMEFYLFRHSFFVLLGLGLIYFCYQLDYMIYSNLAPFLLILAVFLLVITLLFGVEINDARRWLEMPLIGLTFQTSDFAKLALIIYLARVLSNRQEKIKDFTEAFIPVIIPVILICLLIAPADLSTAGMLFLTCLFMMMVGRIQLKYLGVLLLMGGVALSVLLVIGVYHAEIVRVNTWINRINDFVTGAEGYQIEQAKIAIANGGWFGEGPGNSIQRNFLPSPYADFIYAIICEEYGLIGGFFILFAYLFLLIRTIVLVTNIPKAFGAMLAIGISLNLVIQAFLNIAVSVDLVPVTGLSLPLVSMGGTSVIFTCISFGIILSVSRFVEAQRLKEREEQMHAAHASPH